MTSTYFNMTDHTGSSGFLPTVTFDCSNNGIFDTSRRTTQLAAIGITGFYEADFTNNVTTIDVGTFQNDTKVVVVTINRVTSIGASAFSGCTALRSITLDTAVDATYKRYLLTSIGNSAFSGCTSLRNLHIPDTVRSIPNALCQGCTGLEVAVMGYGWNRSDDTYITDGSIGEYAFAGCTSLPFFIIPETVGTVGNNAFNNCTALSYVAIYGKPTFGTNVFQGAKNDSGARYVYDICMNSQIYTTNTFNLSVPSLVSKNEFYEYLFTSSLNNSELTATDVSNQFTIIGSTPSYIKVKIKTISGNSTISNIGNGAFRPNSTTAGISAATYSKIVAISFPTYLYAIGANAFESGNDAGTVIAPCNIGGFYFPNYIRTVGLKAFNVKMGTNDTNFNSTLTKQIVSTSGNYTITTVGDVCFASTIKALIIANCSTISAQYCDTARNLQLVNFFQKNAYSTFTSFLNASFLNTFIAANVGTGTHYIYIPKQVTGSNMTSLFLGTTATMLFTVYDKTADGPDGTSTEGLGTRNSNNTASYLTTANLGIAADKATIHLICNWYDSNYRLFGVVKNYDYNYHVLFHPSIQDITNRFCNNTKLKSIAFHHNASANVSLNRYNYNNDGTVVQGSFDLCTQLAYAYLNKRVKTIGINAFRNAKLSGAFDLIDAAPLESIYHAAFFTDTNYTSELSQITIPNTVKAIGSYAFGCGEIGLKPYFTSMSFATDISFWGDFSNSINSLTTVAQYQSNNDRYMAIPEGLCVNCDYLKNVSFLDTVDANGNDIPTINANGLLQYPDNNLPITTRLNKQILTNKILRIGAQAFYRNQRLQSIRIPDGVTRIDYKTFYDTYSLTYLYLPDTLTTMDVNSSAFHYMNYRYNKFGYTGKGRYVSIRIPQQFIDYVKQDTGSAETGTFNTGQVTDGQHSNSEAATYIFTVSFSNSSVSGKVTNGKLGRFTNQTNPDFIQYHVITLDGITGILGGSTTNARAFDGLIYVKTVTIADTVTTIEDGAFYNCTGLTSVFLSTNSQLVTIGVEAFRDCTSLTNGVYLSNTVKTIGVRAFANALLSNTFDLSSATSLEAIYHAAFYTSAGYTSNLRQITIPSSVKVIGSAAFACNEGSGNPGAKNSFISFSFAGGPNFEFWGDYDDTLTSATTLAAYGYNPADLDTSRTSLRHMAIPAYLFDHCFYLKSVSFLDTVDASGNDIPTINANGMLQYPDLNSPMPTRLNKQILTNKIKRFGIRPFYRCRWLQSIRVPDGVTILGNSSFYDSYSCTYLYLPDSLTTIGTDSFSFMNLVNKYDSSTYANYKYAAIRFPSPFLSGIRTTNPLTASQFGITINTSDAGIYLVRYFFTVDVSSTYSAISNGVFGRFVNNNIDYFQYHVILPNNVHSLLPGATLSTSSFGSLTNLTTITLPSTLRYIPLTSFEGCTYLTNVFIPTTSNLTTIEPYAFKSCSFLTSFFIPNSLHRITFEMFKGCTSLASITYGDNPGIISIDESAFYNTTRALTSIFIPASVVNIGRFAFIGDGGSAAPNILNTVTFGAGSRLKAIGGFAFGHNGDNISNSATYLQNLVLPSTLRYMGGNNHDNGRIFQNAFRNKHTDNFIFPSSVTFLPFACFFADGSTTDISNVYVPMSITATAGPRIHNGYRNNTKGVGGVGGYIFALSRAGSLIYLPSHLSGVTETTSDDNNLALLTFPNSTAVTNRARSYYKSASYSTNPLTSLALQGGVANTSNQATTTQIHADISTSVFVIGDGANSITTAEFGNAANLISVNIPSSVTTIRDHAFKGSSALVYVTFSENSHLTSIGASSFQDCSMIHDIRLPDTLTSIGSNAFSGCRNLTSISIPYNVTSLGSGAFYTNPNTSSTCTQIGSNLTGLEQDSYFGNSISWSSDGLTIAVGAFYYSTTGLVQVYRYISSSWTQIGHLTGTTGSLFGKSVSLSSNGNTLAVGAHGGGGFVRVFTYSNSTWNIIGNITISSGLSASQFGFSVSLSADGTTVAVGVPYYTDAKGLVQVFKYNNSAWNIVGNATDLSGQTNSSVFGVSVSLYSTGTNHILAVGASGHNNNAGYVQVFTSSGTSWTQLGTTINGKAGSHFGLPVSLTSSGTVHTLAAGGCLDPNGGTNRGYVRVYRYSSSWSQLGDLNGLTDYALFGNSVSLSSDGNTLAVGSPQYNSAAGMVEVFKFSGSTWTQIGSDIIGPATSVLGASVSLSSDGRAVACGGVRYLNYTGIVQIYSCSVFKSVQMHQRLYTDISSSLSSYFTSPSSINFQIIPSIMLTNTLNPSKLTLSQINNLYIRYRQSQLGFCSRITVAASSGTTLTPSDVTTALAGITGFVHLDISTNVTSIEAGACLNNTQIYSVAISKTVVTIRTNSFFGCTNLSYLSFHPDSVCTTIGNNAFDNNNIIDLTLPDSLTTIGQYAFQSSNTLTSVCIPKSVTSTTFGNGPFLGCPKLTSVVLPSSLSSLGTGTYFSTSGSTTISFTSYPTTSDIPHFKLSDFSLPSGIVQNVIDSAVTYIDHRAYYYYPDITLYAVNSTYQQTITGGPATYQVNNIKMPIMPATFMMNGVSWQNFNLFPIYRSVPDLNVYSDVSGTVTAAMDNLDDGFLLMPGYSLCVFTNLYDEENISVFDVALANIAQPYTTAVEKSTYIDNQFGKVPINVSGSTYFGINNATSSVLIMFNGKILGKMFAG